uniref:peptidylprolyl isomerase n=1 Tax=Meloidogyne incognita TaxID=6306 RepID=A0A914MWE8_MELIC
MEKAGKIINFKNQKVTKTWAPGQCPRKARRLDFVTFHYKGFSEAGKKFDQSYGRENDGIKIQLGVGMTMPGLDKGIKGMCDGELRKIDVPWRLSRKRKSKIWRFIPNDEHWLRFDIEAIKIEPWTIEGQFEWMDLNNDSKLTEDELSRFDYKMLKEFGKAWPNADIDTVTASKYYIKYFDANNDGIINIYEFKYIFKRDMSIMKSKRKNKEKIEGRKRDPGLQWILDYNNDGIVTVQEIDNADKIFEVNPAILPGEKIKEEL